MIKIETIYDEIKDQGYTWCAVYQGKNKRLLITKRNGVENTPEEVVRRLKKWMDLNPGEYRLQFKVHHNEPDKNSTMHDHVSAGVVDGTHKDFQPPVDLVKLERELRAKIKRENEQAQKELETKQYQEAVRLQYEQLKTFAGKFQAFIEILMMPKTANLQGTQYTNPMNQNNISSFNIPLNNDATDPGNYTDQQKAAVNDAFTFLLHNMSPELFVRFANKVKSDPNVVNMLRSFV